MFKVNTEAIWSTGAYDIPVIILSDLGEDQHGVRWYFVEGISSEFGGKTGVPEHELSLQKKSFFDYIAESFDYYFS